MLMRSENSADAPEISTLVTAAFRDAPCSSVTEAGIVDALRQGGALALSLVAVEDTAVVGYVAFSPVTINGVAMDWFGLGPVAVRRDQQRQGIGGRLIEAGLDDLKKRNSRGCVLLGDPAYYYRFGFQTDPALFFTGAPSKYFQQLRFHGAQPCGEVRFHPAFDSVKVRSPPETIGQSPNPQLAS